MQLLLFDMWLVWLDPRLVPCPEREGGEKGANLSVERAMSATLTLFQHAFVRWDRLGGAIVRCAIICSLDNQMAAAADRDHDRDNRDHGVRYDKVRNPGVIKHCGRRRAS